MSKTGLIFGEDVAGVNQILPHKHPEVWDMFLKGAANNWGPAEINMSTDIEQWKSNDLTKDEKL
ncbi:ribonucleoside-diphosphate reductase, partial [bacterium]|nr:ribonucleoside-diphosphate reductase [bacterium]